MGTTPLSSYDGGMPHGTSHARRSLARALFTTTIHRRLLLPQALADHLLAPEDEVLLALPGVPGDKPRIILVTREEVILGRWNALGRAPKDVMRKRAVPTSDVRGASYRPGLSDKVEIDVRAARDLAIEPCTAEDGIRFTHGLEALATTGQVPAPMPPEDVVAARHHTRGYYSPDSPENRTRAAWNRALMGTAALWNCEAIHGGNLSLGWLQPGEHTLLVLVGQTGISNKYLAVTDRRVLQGSAPGSRTKERPPTDLREAVYDEGRFKDVVRVQMHDGSSLTLDSINPHEGESSSTP